MVWNFFYGTVTGAIGALQGAGPLLNKVYFPPACPAIANWLIVLLQCCIEAGILVARHVHRRQRELDVPPLLPLVIFVGLFSLGLGLIVSVYNVCFRDVGYLVGIAMNLLFYATPIVYTIDHVPEEKWGLPVRGPFELNPITQFVGWSRDAFYLLRWPSAASFFGTAAVSVGMFVLGWYLFSRKAADIVGGAVTTDVFPASRHASDRVAIAVDDVSKRFRLYNEQSSSLKELVTNRRLNRYDDFWALRDVSLEVQQGSVYALSATTARASRPCCGSWPASTGRRAARSPRPAASPRCSSSAPGSTPSSPGARTST